jgi:2-polyprenyl-6-methoxyphenol hydroxylase-like FAD-dependent oxidoreductase
MLLARKGYRVLLVDKARFPSDSINGYYVQPNGVAQLRRWGLFDRLRRTDCPPLRNLMFDFGGLALRGCPPPVEDIVEGYAPRRIVLDKMLVDAAIESGVEFYEGFSVDGLVWDKEQVVGIKSHTSAGVTITESAPIVVGADGGGSIVARCTNPALYNEKPALTCWYYTHWSGIPTDTLEFYLRARRALIACPTNSGLTMILVGAPYDDFVSFRSDIAGNYFKSLDLAPEFADRVHSGKQEERLVGSVNTENFLRRPYGPGWALVGDAGYHHDPSTAQGISDSFRDAQLLSDAIDAGFSEARPLDDALLEYEQKRNFAVMPMYEFSAQLADLREPPNSEMINLVHALQGNQTDTNRFLGVWAGTVSIPEFFAPENLSRIASRAERDR